MYVICTYYLCSYIIMYIFIHTYTFVHAYVHIYFINCSLLFIDFYHVYMRNNAMVIFRA